VTYPVLALFNPPFCHQVNIPLKKGPEFILHPDVIEETPVCVVTEGHDDVKIAI